MVGGGRIGQISGVTEAVTVSPLTGYDKVADRSP